MTPVSEGEFEEAIRDFKRRYPTTISHFGKMAIVFESYVEQLRKERDALKAKIETPIADKIINRPNSQPFSSAGDVVEGPIGFKKQIVCPICGEAHEVHCEYKGMPLLACPKADPNKLYGFKKDAPK